MELDRRLQCISVPENDLQSWLFVQSEHLRGIVSQGWLEEFLSCALDFHQTVWKWVNTENCLLVYLGPPHLLPFPLTLPVFAFQCIAEPSIGPSVPSAVLCFTRVLLLPLHFPFCFPKSLCLHSSLLRDLICPLSPSRALQWSFGAPHTVLQLPSGSLRTPQFAFWCNPDTSVCLHYVPQPSTGIQTPSGLLHCP